MRPDVAAFTEAVYGEGEAFTYAEGQNDYALLKFLDSFGSQQQPIEDLVRESDERPGWSTILDLDNGPTEALGFMAMFVGVKLRSGLSDANQRDRIRSTDGQNRGTLDALRGAAKQYLTGGKDVIIRERDGSAYRLTVITYTSQTPNSGQVLNALLEQKPGGIILNYEVLTGWDYQQLVTAYNHPGKTYASLVADWAPYTYADLNANIVSMG